MEIRHFRHPAVLSAILPSPMPFDVAAVRRQFPLLSSVIGGKSVAYLDSAATSQKPVSVIERMTAFYKTENANVNRGVHPLAEAATIAFDEARQSVRRFIGAEKNHEIIFTRNTTESINLVARSYGELLSPGDRIAVSLAEHHSNIVPWLQLADRKGVAIDWIGLDSDLRFDLASLEKILAEKKTKLVAVTGLSNVTGVATPLEKIIAMAHAADALVLIDAAQLVAHQSVNVTELDADFLAFSGHKLYGPLGIGVLYGKEKLLNAMPAFLGGGDMIATVGANGFTAAELPRKFEAGTPAIAEAVGLGEAIRWIETAGADAMHRWTRELATYARNALAATEHVTVIGPPTGGDLLGCVSFTVDGIHPHDLTEILGRQGICLRAGHHCAEPLHRHLGILASARLSVAAYNTKDEISRAVAAIPLARDLLKK